MIGRGPDRLTPLADTNKIELSRLFAKKGLEAEPIQQTKLRISALMMALCTTALVLTARAADLAIFNTVQVKDVVKTASIPVPARAQIVDRNGLLLASDIETWDVYVSRVDIDDVSRVSARLASVEGALPASVLRRRLVGISGRYRVARDVTPKQRQAFYDLAEPGVQFERKLSRYYPNGTLAANMLGWVDAQRSGAQGVERAFDARLKEGGAPLRLAMDMRVQFTLEDELKKAIAEHKPIAATGIITDITTGEVLAMASWPNFDSNHFNTALPDQRRNRAIADPYELGSVFKPLTLAMALEAGMKMDQVQFDVKKKMVIAGRTIRDLHPGPSPMNATDILVHSSNKGAAQLALLAGADRQREYLDRFGLLDAARIELRESAPDYMASPNWSRIKTATIGYGHGLSVTSLSFVAALAGVVNHGQKLPLSVLPTDPSQLNPVQIVSEETSQNVRTAMRKVVTDGTGRRADVPGYGVAGKTGSAEKWDPATSSYAKDRNVSSFVAIFPWEAPKYLVFVLLDEPQGGLSTSGQETAAWNAAPAVKAIISRIGPLLDAPYSPPDRQAEDNLSAKARGER
ncbi:Cell division protein FtsI [Peptidoglycan synthetase] [hydrothermal vent metagenome]|uniref:Cell division protein FtsI [Peptidoglycan synthetase] n=1 Tax=hydrothermal vent metagenome TaxID=652676 RepID=A0A3B0S2P2_9ZZZZ